MNFCDIPAEAFPKGAQFYHNVTVIVFSIAEDIWDEDFDSIWYLDQLTAPESKAILFFKEEREIINDTDVDIFYDCDEQECDWLLDYYENCIVEVDPDGTISWYEENFNESN